VRGWKRLVAWTAAAVTVVAGLSTTPSSAARPHLPGVRLIAALTHTEVSRFGPKDDMLYLSPGVYLASTGGAFEIDAVRRHGRVSLWQVRRTGGHVERLRKIHPTRRVHLTEGVPDFYVISVRDADGHRVSRSTVPFCGPVDGEYVRVSDAGPAKPTFPQQCGTTLTRGLVLGIDHGWASSLNVLVPFPSKAADGAYTLTIKINAAYRKQLGLAAAPSSASVRLTVKTDSGGKCVPLCPARRSAAQGRRAPDATMPGTDSLKRADGVPDLRALPAHDMSTEHHGQHDFLDFGATIWNAGSGPLVLEGFRRGSRPRMDAVQFVYRHGHPVASHPVGQLEFDKRKGHNHWHLEDVARYDLLDAHGHRVLVSGKQSFCLAPTDPIDLTIRGADWQAESSDLASSCGGEEAIWLREVLQAGWGDTYYQDRAGQSFNITALPNGHYQVRVTADPHHRLAETSYRNNVGLVSIVLGGPAGHRTVKVVR